MAEPEIVSLSEYAPSETRGEKRHGVNVRKPQIPGFQSRLWKAPLS